VRTAHMIDIRQMSVAIQTRKSGRLPPIILTSAANLIHFQKQLKCVAKQSFEFRNTKNVVVYQAVKSFETRSLFYTFKSCVFGYHFADGCSGRHKLCFIYSPFLFMGVKDICRIVLWSKLLSEFVPWFHFLQV
jgi:hypothetical protein